MCTVALAYRRYPGLPILVAANRDEQRARPSTTWREGSLEARAGDALDADTAREVLAPRDRVAGGTWIGLNRSGLVAAVTNRFGNPRDPTRRSRGLLVLDALAAPDVASAARALARTSPRSVSPFHLLIADAERAALVVHDGERVEVRDLEPGWIVVTERSFGAATPEREQRVRAELETYADAPTPQQLHQLLSVHSAGVERDARAAATCVHLDELAYGTRSSSLLYLGDERRLLHADGPPCTTSYADLSTTLARFGEERP